MLWGNYACEKEQCGRVLCRRAHVYPSVCWQTQLINIYSACWSSILPPNIHRSRVTLIIEQRLCGELWCTELSRSGRNQIFFNLRWLACLSSIKTLPRVQSRACTIIFCSRWLKSGLRTGYELSSMETRLPALERYAVCESISTSIAISPFNTFQSWAKYTGELVRRKTRLSSKPKPNPVRNWPGSTFASLRHSAKRAFTSKWHTNCRWIAGLPDDICSLQNHVLPIPVAALGVISALAQRGRKLDKDAPAFPHWGHAIIRASRKTA